MNQDDNELDKQSDSPNEKSEKGVDNMAIIEKELKDMQTLQQKMKRDQLRNALIKKTIQKNRPALERLSRS